MTRNIRPLIESNENVIFTLSRLNKKNGSSTFLFRKPSEKAKQKLEFDLSRIPQTEIDQLIFRLTIYELNYFYYDKIFTLYKLVKSKYQSENSFLSNYVSQLKNKYQFQQFDFNQ